MSLRMRIALSFVILILTSATCTILIGNAIFGRKARELAQARLELDLEVMEQELHAHEALLGTLAASLGNLLEREAADRGLRLCEAAAGLPFDFLVLLDTRSRGVAVIAANRCPPALVQGAAAETLFASDLAALAAIAAADKATRAGTVVLRGELPAVFAVAGPRQPAVLCSAAAHPLPDGRAIVVGSGLGGGLPELARRLGPSGASAEPPGHVSLYLGDALVATTRQPPPRSSRAAPAVVEAVLRKGGRLVTSTPFAGAEADSAYMPIADFRGSIVGMLGIGTREDVYGEIWRRTSLLFTTIIAGGMAFGFLMAWFFSVTLTRPLKELAAGMARVADGELDLEVRVDSGYELGRLSQAFNVMVRGVQERDRRLREATSEKLSQVEKQVSVGRLAAGVAHEINNPMTAILSLSMMLRKSLPPEDPRRTDLDIVVTETQRCREIVRHLLDFAQERPPEKRIVDVNEVMRETLSLTARYEALSLARVDVRLAERPLLVDADPKQIQQVFTNVILNAAEAQQPGGTITIVTGEESTGGLVTVKVVDTGKGIPRECLNRVFEPFFTTKGRGQGTGLGLSVSLGIVQKHGGAIDIESEPERGTTVTITLPAVRQQPEAGAGERR
jgi:two-component system NtrC family sensor kinase